MQNRIPHDVLMPAEMTRRKSRTVSEILEVGSLVLTDEIVKKLRASSSMSNKRTYVQLMHEGIRYNVGGIDKARSGHYRISLISPSATAMLTGLPGSRVMVVNTCLL